MQYTFGRYDLWRCSRRNCRRVQRRFCLFSKHSSFEGKNVGEDQTVGMVPFAFYPPGVVWWCETIDRLIIQNEVLLGCRWMNMIVSHIHVCKYHVTMLNNVVILFLPVLSDKERLRIQRFSRWMDVGLFSCKQMSTHVNKSMCEVCPRKQLFICPVHVVTVNRYIELLFLKC